MITVTAARKNYGDFAALDDVGLEIDDSLALLDQRFRASRPCCAPSPVWNCSTPVGSVSTAGM